MGAELRGLGRGDAELPTLGVNFTRPNSHGRKLTPKGWVDVVGINRPSSQWEASEKWVDINPRSVLMSTKGSRVKIRPFAEIN